MRSASMSAMSPTYAGAPERRLKDPGTSLKNA
jgi:hypothetical protein